MFALRNNGKLTIIWSACALWMSVKIHRISLECETYVHILDCNFCAEKPLPVHTNEYKTSQQIYQKCCPSVFSCIQGTHAARFPCSIYRWKIVNSLWISPFREQLRSIFSRCAFFVVVEQQIALHLSRCHWHTNGHMKLVLIKCVDEMPTEMMKNRRWKMLRIKMLGTSVLCHALFTFLKYSMKSYEVKSMSIGMNAFNIYKYRDRIFRQIDLIHFVVNINGLFIIKREKVSFVEWWRRQWSSTSTQSIDSFEKQKRRIKPNGDNWNRDWIRIPLIFNITLSTPAMPSAFRSDHKLIYEISAMKLKTSAKVANNNLSTYSGYCVHLPRLRRMLCVKLISTNISFAMAFEIQSISLIDDFITLHNNRFPPLPIVNIH